MRFQVEPKPFINALRYAAAVVKRSTTSTLDCVLIEAKDNSISITGTDLDVWSTGKCEGATSETGVALINASDLLAASRGFLGLISAELVSGGLQIISGKTRLLMPTNDGAMPEASKFGGGSEVVGGVEAVASCDPFAMREDADFRRRGVCLDGDSAVAADHHKFFMSKVSGGQGQIIPIEVTGVIAKTGGRLFVNDKLWRVEAEDRVSVGTLIEGPYVNWRALNISAEPFYICDADSLLGAVTSVTFGRADKVLLSGQGESIAVTGQDFTGLHIDGNTAIPSELSSGDVLFKTKQICACLEALSGTIIEFSTDGRAVKMASQGREEYALLSIIRDIRNNLPVAA